MNDYLITIRIKARSDREAWHAWSELRELLEASDRRWSYASVTSPTPFLSSRTSPDSASASREAPPESPAAA